MTSVFQKTISQFFLTVDNLFRGIHYVFREFSSKLVQMLKDDLERSRNDPDYHYLSKDINSPLWKINYRD